MPRHCIPETEEFYDQLRNAISYIDHHPKIVVMEDFNTYVGCNNRTWPGVIGSHRVDSVNGNRLQLLSFCKEWIVGKTHLQMSFTNNP